MGVMAAARRWRVRRTSHPRPGFGLQTGPAGLHSGATVRPWTGQGKELKKACITHSKADSSARNERDRKEILHKPRSVQKEISDQLQRAVHD